MKFIMGYSDFFNDQTQIGAQFCVETVFESNFASTQRNLNAECAKYSAEFAKFWKYSLIAKLHFKPYFAAVASR